MNALGFIHRDVRSSNTQDDKKNKRQTTDADARRCANTISEKILSQSRRIGENELCRTEDDKECELLQTIQTRRRCGTMIRTTKRYNTAVKLLVVPRTNFIAERGNFRDLFLNMFTDKG